MLNAPGLNLGFYSRTWLPNHLSKPFGCNVELLFAFMPVLQPVLEASVLKSEAAIGLGQELLKQKR